MDLRQYKKLLQEITISGVSIMKSSKEAGPEEQYVTIWENGTFQLILRVYLGRKDVLSNDTEQKYVFTLAHISPASASITKRKIVQFALYDIELDISNMLVGL